MNLPKFELVQPQSLQEVCSLLQEGRGKTALLAGGTALIIYLRYRLWKPTLVISLKALTGLKEITRDRDGGMIIGSMVTLEELEKSPFIQQEWPSLAKAAQMVAVPPIRHEATVGGNICLDTRCIFYNQSETWRSGQKDCFKLGGEVCHAVERGRRCQSVCQSDLAPLLIAMGAEVKIASTKGEKIIPLADFFTGRGEKPNLLGPDEILVEVRIPPSRPDMAVAYEKLRIRQGMDFPLAGVAAMVKKGQGGKIEQVKLILGAVGSSPIEVSHSGKRSETQKPTDDLLQSLTEEAMERARPVANLAVDPGYRRKMVGVLVKRAFQSAAAML